MNTWEAWGLDTTPLSQSGVVLHSIPPLLIVLAAEAGPGLRDQLAEAARRADARSVDPPPRDVHETPAAVVHERPAAPVREPVPESAPRPERRRHPRAHEPSGRRRPLADYLADARTALDDAYRSGAVPEVTPRWCRRVTGCSAGTFVKLAAVLRAQELANSGEAVDASHARTPYAAAVPPGSSSGGANR